METAKVAAPMAGNKLYQRRARAALPILVRQAHVGTPMFYSDLAAELGMRNPRNLNYVLGSIGRTMKNLSKAWKQEVPAIQCLVINKGTRLPGNGVGWFITDRRDFGRLSRHQQRQIVNAQLQKIFTFPDWEKVLGTLGLKSAVIGHQDAVDKASNFRGGGESEHHKLLKEYVAVHPEILKLRSGLRGSIEYPLPSGDTIDVLFQDSDEYLGVEVKSAISPETDIIRGVFQCIKYKAVLNAYLASREEPQNGRTVLVLGSAFPPHLNPLKHMLGVEVVANVKPQLI